MYVDIKEDPKCEVCHVQLHHEDKVIGLVERQTLDIYSCPSCRRLYSTPRKQPHKRLAS
jgi:ribosomal protein L37AE/L43A